MYMQVFKLYTRYHCIRCGPIFTSLDAKHHWPELTDYFTRAIQMYYPGHVVKSWKECAIENDGVVSMDIETDLPTMLSDTKIRTVCCMCNTDQHDTFQCPYSECEECHSKGHHWTKQCPLNKTIVSK